MSINSRYSLLKRRLDQPATAMKMPQQTLKSTLSHSHLHQPTLTLLHNHNQNRNQIRQHRPMTRLSIPETSANACLYHSLLTYGSFRGFSTLLCQSSTMTSSPTQLD